MTAVGDNDSSLAAKCLDLCQTLACQGLAFNFSLTISSSFSFSLDTRDKGLALATTGKTKKKSSLSTLRRNARRKEAFLQRKQNPAPVSYEVEVDHAADLPQNGEDTFKCNICGNAFKSDKGLRIHKGKSHKGSELPHCEKIRDPGIDLSLNVTQVKDIREEGTNLQLFECDACGKKFESEDTLDNHMEIHGACVRCASCTQFFYDCDEAIACPGCSHPWPFWRSRPRL